MLLIELKMLSVYEKWHGHAEVVGLVQNLFWGASELREVAVVLNDSVEKFNLGQEGWYAE